MDARTDWKLIYDDASSRLYARQDSAAARLPGDGRRHRAIRPVSLADSMYLSGLNLSTSSGALRLKKLLAKYIPVRVDRCTIL